MAEYAGEKTLDPTLHRRQQARREGHVAKSHELGSAALLLTSVGLLTVLGGGLAAFLIEFCRSQLGGEPWLNADVEFAVGQWNALLLGLGRRLLPILGLVCLAGAAVNVLQSGFLFLPQKLVPDVTRLDPIRGLQRMFSTAGMVRLILSVAKLGIVAAVAWTFINGRLDEILAMVGLETGEVAAGMTGLLLDVALRIGAALMGLAALDYAYQWWRYEQDLKMTPQELREELRNLEGNPQLIARRKQIRRDLAVQRMSGGRLPLEQPQQGIHQRAVDRVGAVPTPHVPQ